MPVFDPANPGDIVYPKYAVVTTEPISAALQILQGRLYTKDAAGYLIVVAASLADGFYQAISTPDEVSGVAGEDSVQVLGPRTRMLFTTQTAGLKVGQDVIYVAAGTDVINGAKSDGLYVGKIFEIYSLDSDQQRKPITEVGDKVIVETVQA